MWDRPIQLIPHSSPRYAESPRKRWAVLHLAITRGIKSTSEKWTTFVPTKRRRDASIKRRHPTKEGQKLKVHPDRDASRFAQPDINYFGLVPNGQTSPKASRTSLTPSKSRGHARPRPCLVSQVEPQVLERTVPKLRSKDSRLCAFPGEKAVPKFTAKSGV